MITAINNQVTKKNKLKKKKELYKDTLLTSVNVDPTLVVQLLFTESPVGQTGFIWLPEKKTNQTLMTLFFLFLQQFS